MNEKQIEKYANERVSDVGGLNIKQANPMSRGWPDQLYILPEGRVFLIEFKSPGKVASELQEWCIEKIEMRGIKCYVCDSKDSFEAALKEQLARLPDQSN